MATHQNRVILQSIPLPADFKRYFIMKWKHLNVHNGPMYASNIFKKIKEIAMAYISDEDRINNRNDYINSLPIRKNGWAMMIFDLCETNPHAVLDFFKIYTSFEEPLVSVKESSDSQHQYLRTRSDEIDDTVPQFLVKWVSEFKLYRNLKFGISSKRGLGYGPGLSIVRDQNHPLHRLSEQEVNSYWKKWIRIFDRNYQFGNRKLKFPNPTLYSDYGVDIYDDLSSDQFSEDLRDLVDLVADESWDQDILDATVYSHLPDEFDLFDDAEPRSVPSGNVHHIPKKGTVNRRPIAVPNRFLQTGLEPLGHFLYDTLSLFPHDATFDQNRFTRDIQSRVDQHKYVGSVDLSQATDNLPVSWFHYIYNELFDHTRIPEEIQNSYRLFQEMLKHPWRNGDHQSYWTIGQPLGTYPSFAILGITHNIIAEALAYDRGYTHSPYYIIGDDIVFLSKSLRKKYIGKMGEHHIPLSLHKSYENRLTEFAGRIYIRNQHPHFVSDHNLITWPSLFDYQSSTGIMIPWRNLPKSLQRRWAKSFDSVNDAQYGYNISRIALSASQSPSIYKYGKELSEFFFNLEKDKAEPLEPQSINTFMALDWIMSFQTDTTDSTEKGVSNWYKLKFRPHTTDHIARSASAAIMAVRSKSA